MPKTSKVRRRRVAPALSRHRAPLGMPLETWQRQLREDFGKIQDFRLTILDGDDLPCDCRVDNPQRGTSYTVKIRGPGADRCTCPDFRTSGLDTCKHLAFVRHRLAKRVGKRAWKHWNKAPIAPAFSEIVMDRSDASLLRFRPAAELPPVLTVLMKRLCNAHGVLIRDDALDRLETAARKCGHEVRIDEAVLDREAERRDALERYRRIEALFPHGEASPAFTRLLHATLLPYQREGSLFAARAGRSLIADDMGLGKTIQALAARAIMTRAGLVRRTLVVCPASLVHQWGEELRRFADESACVVAGSIAVRTQRWADPAPELKICTYDTVHRDLAQIRAWDPDLLILDEAQRIKNWPTRAAQAVKRLETTYAIILTGTPLENKLEELHSLVEVIDPHLLGPLFRFKHAHEQRDTDGRVIGYAGLDRIADSLKGVLIRRTKAQVLTQLPGRSDRTLFVPLGNEQRRHHQELAEIVGRIVKRWRRLGFLSESDQRNLTASLMKMRMACDSTYLLDPKLDEGAKVGEIAIVLDEFFASEPDGKVVIFSAWLKMHELLASAFNQRGWGHVLFHGGVPTEQRGALVQRFKDDPACRVFLSTDAGGVGLNLQWASLVVNADLPWNPAVLEQRIARIHRMGQKRPVQVVNLVAENSIESGILGLLAFKKSMAAGILDGGESTVNLGGSRLKRFMEQVEQATGGTTDTVTNPTDNTADHAAEIEPLVGPHSTDAETSPTSVADGEKSSGPDVSPNSGPTPEPVSANPNTCDNTHAQATAELLTGASHAIAGLARLFAAGEVHRDAAGNEHLRIPMPDRAKFDAVRQALAALAALG